MTRPAEDVPARFVTTFLGERTPIVGRTGLSAREHTMAPAPGPWAALSAEPRDARPRGEADRPPLGRPAWGWHPWQAGGDGERAVISKDPRILTLLDDAREWLDFEGTFGVEGSMDTDLGVSCVHGCDLGGGVEE